MNWKHYSALASSTFLLTKECSAQIIYTDIEDMGIKDYSLDLNNDGITDFIFLGDFNLSHISNSIDNYYLAHWYNLISAQGNNEVVADNSFVDTLVANTEIGPNMSWKNNASYLAKGWFMFECDSDACINPTTSHEGVGPWYGVSDHYVGLRLFEGTDTLYGWARLDITLIDYWTWGYVSNEIKDYAIQLTPNTPILSGQGYPLAVNELSKDISPKVIAREGKVIQIQFQNSDFIEGRVTVINTMGQLVVTKKIEYSFLEFQLAESPLGSYYIAIEKDGHRFSQSIILY